MTYIFVQFHYTLLGLTLHCDFLLFIVIIFYCSASLWALIVNILVGLIILKNIHPATNAVIEVLQ